MMISTLIFVYKLRWTLGVYWENIELNGQHLPEPNFSFNLHVDAAQLSVWLVIISRRFFAKIYNSLLNDVIDPNFCIQATMAIVRVLREYRTEWSTFARPEFFVQFTWGCSIKRVICYYRRFFAKVYNLLLNDVIDPNFCIQATMAIGRILRGYKTEW